MTLSKPLVLTGMMGSGKTTVGKALARHLQVPFIDLDAEIERDQKATVRDIFSKYGEAAFRAIEKEKIAALLRQGPAVIATGGGAVVDESTRTLLHECATTVWLKADIETLARRIAGDETRPLLAGGEPRQVLRRILSQREPFYAQARVVVDNSGSHADTAVEEILRAVQNAHK